MPSLKELRRRIHSVENIRQITRSMEMVAAALLQKALIKAERSRIYLKKMREITADMIDVAEDKLNPFIKKGSGNLIALVIVSSDRGLCGSYNSALLSNAEKYLKDHSSEKFELILIGRKAIDHFSRKRWPIGKTLAEWGGKITEKAINEFTHALKKDFLNKRYAAVRLCYTEYETVFLRHLINIPLLPIETIEPKKRREKPDFVLEPNSEELSQDLYTRLCDAEVYNMLDQAYASELSARVCAMRAATKNAEEMIDQLTKERNKVRQESITKEMLEISTGAEAMK